MGLVALQSLVCTEAAGASGSLLPPWLPCFQRACVVYLGTGPRSLASPGSSSPELPPLQSTAAPNLPHTQGVWRLPWGSPPHRDISGESLLSSELPRSRSSFRPQRFSRSRRLVPLSALRVCFTPQPRPGFTFQGFAPAAEPHHLIDGRCPLAVTRPTPAAELPRRRRHRPPRLQGFDPGSSSRLPTGCLAPPTPPSPLRFQLPRAFLRTPRERLHALSAHGLGRQTLRVSLAAGLQRIDQRPTWYSVPRLPSRSSFLAYPARPPKRNEPSEARLSQRPTTTAEQSRGIAPLVPRRDVRQLLDMR
jgi:hypothetical protein